MNSKLTPQHSHDFLTNSHRNAKKVAIVFTITVVTMGAEIAAGIWSGSMALLADGWHMGTHAAAFAIAMFTYSYACKHKGDASFSFGPGKVQPLGGFASAVALGVVAILMAIESIGYKSPLKIPTSSGTVYLNLFIASTSIPVPTLNCSETLTGNFPVAPIPPKIN